MSWRSLGDVLLGIALGIAVMSMLIARESLRARQRRERRQAQRQRGGSDMEPSKWMVARSSRKGRMFYRACRLKDRSAGDGEPNREYAGGWVVDRRGAQALADWLNEKEART